MSNVDPQTYSTPSIAVQGYDTADSLGSSMSRRAQPSECSLVNIVSQSGTQSSGGQILINLANTPNTFIKNGSVYLRVRLSMTNVIAAAGDSAYLSSSPTGSWASIINRITVSCGSNVIEQINNYGLAHHEVLLLHASSGNYFQQDMKLLECGLNNDQGVGYVQGVNQFQWANGVGIGLGTRFVILTIPLFLGSINNPQENKNFPLGLLTGGCQVLIDLNNFATASYKSAGTNGLVTDFSVSQASISYEAIKVSSEYMNALRGSLAQSNQLFQMPFVSSLVMNVASSAVLDVTYGLGLNSMKAVLFTQKPSAGNVLKVNKYNESKVLRVYADGKLQNNYNIDDRTTYYAELNRSLGNLASRSSTSGPSDMFQNYDTLYFYSGVAFNKLNDSSLAMTGSACQQLQFHLESTPIAGDSTFIVIFYDCVLTASPMSGEVSILR